MMVFHSLLNFPQIYLDMIMMLEIYFIVHLSLSYSLNVTNTEKD